MDARAVLMKWIDAFASRDPLRVAALYHPDAVNWQVANEPAIGQPRIRELFAQFFASFPDSYTRFENIIAEGDWAAWEWIGGGTFLGDLGSARATGRPYEIRGSGFFRVVDGKITLQRGYWDKASWYAQIGISHEGAGNDASYRAQLPHAKDRGPGFVVVYRWRLHPGKEHSFAEAWSAVTNDLLKAGGSLGSRLHRGPDDIWYAYAQWESADARRRAFEGSGDAELHARMRSAIAETYPELVLECVADFLTAGGAP